jgi:hypothetical protein
MAFDPLLIDSQCDEDNAFLEVWALDTLSELVIMHNDHDVRVYASDACTIPSSFCVVTPRDLFVLVPFQVLQPVTKPETHAHFPRITNETHRRKFSDFPVHFAMELFCF